MANLRQAEIPQVVQLRQHFVGTAISNIEQATVKEMRMLFPNALTSAGEPLRGKSIGITAGSRGITNLALIIKTVVSFLKEQGAHPFIFPAMGSHGGGTAEGQIAVLAEYGVTPEAMGCPIRAEMETAIHGVFNGITVHCARVAYESDGIILLNRIKVHTDICEPPDPQIVGFEIDGRIESGLSKIAAIGAGKLEGAKEYHDQVLDRGLVNAIVVATRELIKAGKILGGLAILENAHHQTAKLEAVPCSVDDLPAFFNHEARLLDESRALMPKLPLPIEGVSAPANPEKADALYDVLFVQEIGKNISGAGMDTNIIGRSPYEVVPGKPWNPGMPSINRIVISDLTPESHGNAIGMGNATFATERFQKKVNFAATILNGVTAHAPLMACLPACLANDRQAISAALAGCFNRPGGRRFVAIKNTLELEQLLVSEACLPLLLGISGIEIVGELAPVEFDAQGFLVFPF